VLARLSSKHSIAISNFFGAKRCARQSLPHFVVDEREIKIDISFKDSAIDGEPADIDVVAA